MPNLRKWVNLSFLICGVLVGFLFREAFSSLYDWIGWRVYDWVLSPADLSGIAVGFILFVGLVRSEKATNFLTDVLVELSKVTWPNRKETLVSTGVVSILLGIAALCVTLFDSVWMWITEKFLY
ncbi:MAG: preprotein translocase subunit SecE [Deltaproteobacteria bacterium]|nr:preprotein translocase subunit SecE [Deltaproteobacteria bacterium]